MELDIRYLRFQATFVKKYNLIWIDNYVFIWLILTFMSLEDISEHDFALHFDILNLDCS